MKNRTGSAGIFDALLGVEFPADKAQVLRLAGDQQVEFLPYGDVPLRSILEKSEKTEFESMLAIADEVQELLKANPPSPVTMTTHEVMEGQGGKRELSTPQEGVLTSQLTDRDAATG